MDIDEKKEAGVPEINIQEANNNLSEDQRNAILKRLNKEGAQDDVNVSNNDVEYLLGVIATMSNEEAEKICRDQLEYHDRDPNFPANTRDLLESLLEFPDAAPYEGTPDEKWDTLKLEAALMHYHSPYPDVRSIADPYDDPEMPVETFRSYFLGILWVIVGSGVNMFFEPRLPKITIPVPLLQLLLAPCGKLMEYLPNWGFKFRGTHYALNPGPWSLKEQVFVTIMFGITQQLSYVCDQIYVQRLGRFYNNQWAGFGYQFTLIMSTQFIGFGLAGLARHILVYPEDRLWPTNFPILALNRAVLQPEKKESINGWTISRYRFFAIVFVCMFFYFWLPDYLFTALSTFNWTTWISPNNFNLAAITGIGDGLGIQPFPSFDWNMFEAVIKPLYTPWYSIANNFIGALFAGAVVIPAVYYTNMYYSAYLPINSNAIFTNTGEEYEVTKVIDGGGRFNEEKYQKYSPPYYAAANLVLYGAFFAMYPAMFVDSCLRHWRLMKEGTVLLVKSLMGKVSLKNTYNDPHSRMMAIYKEVPQWWFLATILISLALGIICVEVYPTDAPVWGIFFAIGISTLFLIPIGILYSSSNSLFSLNVIAELVAGYAFPGKGVALMIIKAFGVNTNVQTIYFTQDQKLGHYAKIPPRATFRAQMIATFIQALVVMGVSNWQINNYDGICEPGQPQKFTCPNQVVFYSASVVWGVIGPKRVFDGLYPILKWTFLIGAFVPVPFFLAEKFIPQRFVSKKFWRFIDPLLWLFGMLQFYAPYNLGYITPAMYIGFTFMYYIRKHYTAWFEKYTYVLSSGLSAGVAFSAIIIFFAVQYKPKDLNWWGNSVSTSGIDGNAVALKPIPEKGFFGPPPGSYP
jgi:OPT family small oligopeptide transporter